MPAFFIPSQIRSELGLELARDGYAVEWFTEDDCPRMRWMPMEGDDPEGMEEDEEDWITRMREEAMCHRDNYIYRNPPNAFRDITRLEHDSAESFYFEHILTDAGERARACYLANQCCDERGNLLIDATLTYWFDRLEDTPIHMMEMDRIDNSVGKWINEPWADGFSKALTLRKQGICAFRSGAPDHANTLRLWMQRASSPGIEGTAEMIDSFNIGWYHEPWAAPLRSMYENASQLIYSHPDGSPDHQRTLNHWATMTVTKAERQKLVENRSLLLKLPEEWAQPIHDAVMEAIMKSNDVALV